MEHADGAPENLEAPALRPYQPVLGLRLPQQIIPVSVGHLHQCVQAVHGFDSLASNRSLRLANQPSLGVLKSRQGAR
jgi:hypothetical protein